VNADFPRILTLLRKEKGISQKEVAAKLGISQALLSHYEKGIRECGLDFLVRCAAFYEVSTDYLLGISPERSGSTIAVEDIPEADAAGKENKFSGSILPVLNKKLIANSLNVLFDQAGKVGSEKFVTEVSDYLMLAVYRMFRMVYRRNPKNPAGMFRLNGALQEHYADAAMQLCEARAAEALAEATKNGEVGQLVTTESLGKDYPLFASSLLNLIQNAEKSVDRSCGKE